MGAARLALVPRELDVALRCVELHVVGERQDGVRRGVGGERLPWLVVHPVDAGSALLLPAPIDHRGALVEVRQLHQGIVARLPRNRCQRNRQTSSLSYKTMYHAYRKTRLRVHVRVLRCRLRWQSSRSYRYSMPIPQTLNARPPELRTIGGAVWRAVHPPRATRKLRCVLLVFDSCHNSGVEVQRASTSTRQTMRCAIITQVLTQRRLNNKVTPNTTVCWKHCPRC